MSRVVLASVIAGVLVVVLLVLVPVEYYRLALTTQRRLLRANGLVRLGRAYRSRWIRVAAACAAWPHLVELVTRLPRAGIEPPSGQVVLRAGPLRVLHYLPRGDVRRDPVLVVHALVTRPWVLDLAHGHSLIAALADAGHPVYLLDWGIPGPQQATSTLDTYAALLLDVERQVRTRTGSGPLHLIGYCLGGTLVLGVHAAHGTNGVASITAIAPPIDTQVPGGIGAILRNRRLTPLFALDDSGLVPASVVRETFHLLRPRAINAARTAWRHRRDREWRRIAGPLSRWVWEHTPLPGALFFDIVDLYRGNQLMNRGLQIHGATVDLASLDCPVLIAATVRDHIVPQASSLAIQRLKDVDVVQCAGGHVAMLAGHEGQRVLYPAITQWLQSRETIR